MAADKHGGHVLPVDGDQRRGFLVSIGAVIGGAVAVLTPLLAGLNFVLHPLRRRVAPGEDVYFRVASLDGLPADGVPRQFAVTADQRDAWTFATNQRIGAVYLRRQSDGNKVQAFNVVCPHAGCFVGFDAKDKNYLCPCHNSSFSIEGEVIAPSPSPRGLDELAVKVEPDGSIWVAFKNFVAGRAEKVVRA
ncbi:MAG: Rieske (2Fe-2S) protein [Pirellulales bacterium]